MSLLSNINTNYDCPALLRNNAASLNNTLSEKIWHDKSLPHDYFVNTDSFLKKHEKEFETTYILKNEELNSRWILLYDLFKHSYNSKAHSLSDTSFDTIENTFTFSLNNILKLEPKITTVGISEEDCVYIYAEFKNKKVFFNMFFEDDKADIILNISENGKPICSYNADVESSFQTLKTIVGEIHESDNYDLSRAFITSVQL